MTGQALDGLLDASAVVAAPAKDRPDGRLRRGDEHRNGHLSRLGASGDSRCRDDRSHGTRPPNYSPELRARSVRMVMCWRRIIPRSTQRSLRWRRSWPSRRRIPCVSGELRVRRARACGPRIPPSTAVRAARTLSSWCPASAAVRCYPTRSRCSPTIRRTSSLLAAQCEVYGGVRPDSGGHGQGDSLIRW